MPEQPQPKIKPHPWKHLAPGEYTGGEGAHDEAYVELHVTSNFTFLHGASHPEELVQQAATLGHCAAAITDRNTLSGIVRAHIAAKDIGIPLVVGCRVELQTQPEAPPLSVLVYPTNRAAYSRLCRLLTLGKRRAPKGQCELTLHDLIEHHEGLLAIIVPPAVLDENFIEIVRGLGRVFNDDRLWIASSCLYGPDDRERLAQLISLSHHTKAPLVATNDVHYHVADRRPLQDVLTCIRLGCTLPEAGFRLFAHAERHLKRPQEMARLFAEHPQAITRTVEIANRAAAFNLDELRYEYPDEICPPHRTPMQYLIDLTWQGAAKHYPHGVPKKVRRQIENEFALIDELNYAPYFLTVYDLVVFARSRGILCQGRGAAANSAVCYCLGVTAVDPDRIDLLFERFVSRERNEPPDIDIDFEHERREEVIQYIYSKYGRERAALTAEVITYRGKSAVREVGKALGLSLDCVDRLSKSMDWWEKGKLRPTRLRELGLNPNDPTIHHLVQRMNEILGFPRHLSQHVGGFVITKGPLCELVPIENAAMKDRTVIEWDKDDIDALGMLKVDVLGLGMLTCIRKCFDLVNGQYLARREYTAVRPRCIHRGLNGGRRTLELHTVPSEDPAVYDMICAADTIGVFQIESRAQMSMLPRLRPRCFYDLVIEVAIVRPGPIQGKMVHPYLRRRNGEEPVTYPDERVKEVLGKTLGIPLFQEQAMRLAIVGAGFTPDEADQLRRAMAAWKRKGNQIEKFGTRLIDGMLKRGYPLEFAERCFEQIKGFSDYGFPESHAASFALLVYVSAWLKRHYPAAFGAALINSQPMGFYAPAQIVRDAQEHGVKVRPVDVNYSQWDCTLGERKHEGTPPEQARRHEGAESFSREPKASAWGKDAPSLRLGMRLIKGLREDEANAISQAVDRYGSFTSIERLWRTSSVRIATLRALARADAFGSMGLDRQAALWEIRRLRDDELPLFDGKRDNVHLAPGEYTGGSAGGAGSGVTANSGGERDVLPPISQPRKVVQDYAAVGLSLKAHPISFIRLMLESRGAIEAAQLKDAKRYPQGMVVSVAGIVLVRQRPATASGIIFMTLEDETGISNLIIRPHIYERFRPAARHGVIILARGRVERQGEVIHILVDHLERIEWPAEALQASSRDFH
ncbi:MAG: error-prone DNA polymerase [Planctomycetes bacterium]|nr:error-prone DNA polymerase [Planctomycetota bacterium]